MAANTILKKTLKSHITPGIIINEKTTRTNHTQTEVLHIHPKSQQISVHLIPVQEVEEGQYLM